MMFSPNYRDGSIVNLMSSIGSAFGSKPLYGHLKSLRPEEIKGFKNVILFVVDGMGYEFIMKNPNSFLAHNVRSKICSVFPPTTAAAISSFATGVAPQQHAMTGWFMNLKEVGAVCAPIPFTLKFSKTKISEDEKFVSGIIDAPFIDARLNRKCIAITGDRLYDSAFNRGTAAHSKRIGYADLNGLFKNLKRAVDSEGNKFIYVYWGGFDHSAHHSGVNSVKTGAHFRLIDRSIESFSKSLTKDDLLIVTSDHGFIDVPETKVILLKDHPVLEDCLSMPLCGEPRTAYCYVYPDKAKTFESYVKRKLSRYCHLFKSSDLVNDHFFGLGKPSPKLFHRIGDYVLVMKENYIIRDQLSERMGSKHIGNHGGTSSEEIFIPLIVVKKTVS